ncbi:uncharacterized protein MONOS_11024 [Monocercomonoides exilis]|uniref:uncharacterized protein n=1 Tax=Monocercomonoides exilis TaxID=2049356 RepID=UPI00355A3642|nr:hypothetical protein MONOS_11024 [Monocercomonoides exilis]|eukprot:MONOS_11024.1-p1 / transcript=MONOS_11024.1 / gene=MONOS_11024 / organism=Monocercomonoides_exilis_PA203 / gene_product=unspecified product / transcript_product=unspecified product / location=Mono_scaffold00529:23413-24150(+) / protein_length=246 / sequence_SO=supercontig / SO=protein_coding / is_pseudo=false
MEASTAGPTSGLSGDFSLGGSTGGVGLFQPTSSSSSLTSDQFPATSQPAPADRTESHVPSFSSLCQDKFNDNINSSVFDLHTDSADLAKTVEQLESIAFTPFIPARTHHHARSSNWLRDVLDSSENRVERYLILASKDLIMSRPEGEARKERTSDVMLLIAEALQEESHTRIQAEFGFDAARTLKEDQKDPLVSSDKLAKITPKLEAWKTRREAIIRAQRTRTYFFRGATSQGGTRSEGRSSRMW